MIMDSVPVSIQNVPTMLLISTGIVISLRAKWLSPCASTHTKSGNKNADTALTLRFTITSTSLGLSWPVSGQDREAQCGIQGRKRKLLMPWNRSRRP